MILPSVICTTVPCPHLFCSSQTPRSIGRASVFAPILQRRKIKTKSKNPPTKAAWPVVSRVKN